MTATARVETQPLDWKLWVPGVGTPIACFIVDYIAGEYVLQLTPAALLSLAIIGIASLVVSRNQRQRPAGLTAVGPMWLVGGLTLALGLLLAVPSGMGLLFSLPMVWRSPEAVLFLAWALLGFTPLWTGVTYLKQASALTGSQVVTHGRPMTSLFGTLGGVIALAMVIAAQVIDFRLIKTWTDALDSKGSPEAWQAAFQSLNAYPLCGRSRCLRLVCNRLDGQFPLAPSGNLDVPARLDDAFKQAFGAPTAETCSRHAD